VVKLLKDTEVYVPIVKLAVYEVNPVKVTEEDPQTTITLKLLLY
jgi:hypothetical protein